MAKMACAQCGGAKRMQDGGTASKKAIRQGMRAVKKADRQDKKFMNKYEKQKAEELMKSKRFKEGGMTGIIGMPKYGNNPRTQEGRMLKKGGSAASKKCPPGHYWTADLGCQPKYEGYKGPLSSIGAKLGVGSGIAAGIGMAAKAISDRKKRKAAEKEESMKLVNDARKIKNKLAPKKYGGLAKADSGMQVKPNITRPLPPNTSGVKKTYANGGVTQSFAQNRAVMASCKNGMVRDASGKCVMERKMSKGGLAKAQTGTTVPAGTVVKGGKVWNGKGYNPAPVNPAPANTVPVGTVINDGRIWNGKGYDPAPVKGKRGGTKMAKGGMTKAKKFAALAPPYNKATAADRIAGAKKNKRK